jgi:hypothetical protein
MSLLTKPKYEARILPEPNPSRMLAVFDTFLQEFVSGPFPALRVVGQVRSFNAAYERTLTDEPLELAGQPRRAAANELQRLQREHRPRRSYAAKKRVVT